MFRHVAIVRLDPFVLREKNAFCNALLIYNHGGGGTRSRFTECGVGLACAGYVECLLLVGVFRLCCAAGARGLVHACLGFTGFCGVFVQWTSWMWCSVVLRRSSTVGVVSRTVSMSLYE
jgi:hypothetical protein